MCHICTFHAPIFFLHIFLQLKLVMILKGNFFDDASKKRFLILYNNILYVVVSH